MPSRKSALIVLNGELGDLAPARAAARRCRGIVCADGGLRNADELGLRADFVVGDMDSLPRGRRRGVTYWCDFDENRSDFEKALEFVEGLGCDQAYVVAAMGGRADHALVNLGVIESYGGPLDLILLDGGAARLLGPGRYRLSSRGRFSLLAAPSAVVTLSRARYALKDFELKRGARGLGNWTAGGALLTVRAGRLWLACDKLPAGW